jgi:hypothetical protein
LYSNVQLQKIKEFFMNKPLDDDFNYHISSNNISDAPPLIITARPTHGAHSQPTTLLQEESKTYERLENGSIKITTTIKRYREGRNKPDHSTHVEIF